VVIPLLQPSVEVSGGRQVAAAEDVVKKNRLARVREGRDALTLPVPDEGQGSMLQEVDVPLPAQTVGQVALDPGQGVGLEASRSQPVGEALEGCPWGLTGTSASGRGKVRL